MEEGQTQSTFTGAQERSGISICAFATQGLYGVGRRRPIRPPSSTGTAARRRARSSRSAARRGATTTPAAGLATTSQPASVQQGGPKQPSAVLFADGDALDDDELPSNFTFDWNAYRSAFGNVPMEDAVPAMFAEYAMLYARIAGWVTSHSLPPMTLDRAEDISKHAEHSILKYVTAILGVVQTLKVHKLLCHILDTIKLHGKHQNCNTSGTEA